jgi:hypothetical protein
MEYLAYNLIDTAMQSPTNQKHAAMLVRKKRPIRNSAIFNDGPNHAEMRCCVRYIPKTKRREKG